MTAITIQPKNEADYQLFVSLAKRLKAKVSTPIIDDEAPTKAQILQQLCEDFRALQNGTLVTRPASELLLELKVEGLL